jgi:transposase-like protein
VRLAAFLDISRTALRAVAPIVDLLVRLGAAKREVMTGIEHRQHKGLNNKPRTRTSRRVDEGGK